MSAVTLARPQTERIASAHFQRVERAGTGGAGGVLRVIAPASVSVSRSSSSSQSGSVGKARMGSGGGALRTRDSAAAGNSGLEALEGGVGDTRDDGNGGTRDGGGGTRDGGGGTRDGGGVMHGRGGTRDGGGVMRGRGGPAGFRVLLEGEGVVAVGM